MRTLSLLSLAACGAAFIMPAAVPRPSVALRASTDVEAEAKAATPGSKAAAVAWDAVEEVRSADNTAATRPGLDQTCEVEKLEVCAEYESQMAELEKILSGAEPSSGMSLRDLAEANKKLIEENSRLRKSLGTYK